MEAIKTLRLDVTKLQQQEIGQRLADLEVAVGMPNRGNGSEQPQVAGSHPQDISSLESADKAQVSADEVPKTRVDELSADLENAKIHAWMEMADLEMAIGMPKCGNGSGQPQVAGSHPRGISATECGDKAQVSGDEVPQVHVDELRTDLENAKIHAWMEIMDDRFRALAETVHSVIEQYDKEMGDLDRRLSSVQTTPKYPEVILDKPRDLATGMRMSPLLPQHGVPADKGDATTFAVNSCGILSSISADNIPGGASTSSPHSLGSPVTATPTSAGIVTTASAPAAAAVHAFRMQGQTLPPSTYVDRRPSFDGFSTTKAKPVPSMNTAFSGAVAQSLATPTNLTRPASVLPQTNAFATRSMK